MIKYTYDICRFSDFSNKLSKKQTNNKQLPQIQGHYDSIKLLTYWEGKEFMLLNQCQVVYLHVIGDH